MPHYFFNFECKTGSKLNLGWWWKPKHEESKWRMDINDQCVWEPMTKWNCHDVLSEDKLMQMNDMQMTQ